MLDSWNLAVPKLIVKNIAAKTPIRYVIFGIVVYIHIGVGFGVARSTIRAMPEPQLWDE